MIEGDKVFKYELASLQKKEAWEELVLAAELVRAIRVVEEKQRSHREVLRAIVRAQAQLRDLYRPTVNISLARREMLETFLHEQHHNAGICEEEVKRAQKVCDDIGANLEAKRRQIKVLERHQDRRREAHNEQQMRQALKSADELWLLRRGGA